MFVNNRTSQQIKDRQSFKNFEQNFIRQTEKDNNDLIIFSVCIFGWDNTPPQKKKPTIEHISLFDNGKGYTSASQKFFSILVIYGPTWQVERLLSKL